MVNQPPTEYDYRHIKALADLLATDNYLMHLEALCEQWGIRPAMTCTIPHDGSKQFHMDVPATIQRLANHALEHTRECAFHHP